MIRAVKIRAGAGAAFIAPPIRDATNRIQPIGAVFDCNVPELEQQILAPVDDGDGFESLETWLHRQLITDSQSSVDCAVELVQRIQSDSCITSVEALASASGMARRSLQRLFRDYVGVSPKWVIRRHRMQEAAWRMKHGKVESLAALAAQLDYADHSHFTREFRAAVGRTPTDFLKTFG